MSITFTFLKKETRPAVETLQVVLGSHTVKAFVYAPKDVQVMGIVRCGMEFGLLALTAAGNYLRINGSASQRLNNRDVEAAIGRARLSGRGESFASSRAAGLAPETAPVPTVVQKKHRRIDAGLAANGRLHPSAA